MNRWIPATTLWACLGAIASIVSTPPPSSAQAQAQANVYKHADSERAADQYEAWLMRTWTADGLSARVHLKAGETILASGNAPQAAARRFIQAIAADRKSADAWLGLSRALLAKPASQSKPQSRSSSAAGTARNAGGAAYRAYQLATSESLKARALATLGEALRRRSYWRPALEALKTSLALNATPGVRASYEKLHAKRGFRIVNYAVDNQSASPRLCVTFSEVLRGEDLDYAPFVSVDGDDPQAVSAQGRQLCIGGLTHGERYQVKLRDGLPAKLDDALSKTAALAIYVKDRPASVRLSARSYVLPRVGQSGIPVTTVNTAKVAIEIYRVGDRGLAGQVVDGTLSRQIGQWEIGRLQQRLGEKIYEGSLATRVERNKAVTTAIPVNEAVPQIKPGVYALIARPANATARRSRDAATQWFIVSDLGLTTVKGDDGLHTFVRSLQTAAPSDGVELRLIARNNEVLATAKTDGNGYAHIDAGAIGGEGGLAPAVLMAQASNSDFAFLDLTANAFDLTDRGVKGRNAPGPIDAFVYTDRGVYRPGDTVHASALIRLADGKASPTPVTLIVARPDGVAFTQTVLTDAGAGGRSVPLALPQDAMTGTWRIRVHIDPKQPAIAQTAVLVEDFLPERLALNLDAKTPQIAPSQPYAVTLAARYLYGAKARDLAVEGEVIVKPVATDSEHAGYRFGLADRFVSPTRAPLETNARTDDDGRATVSFTLPPIPRTAKPLQAKLLVRLREPGGRTIERSVSRPVATGLPRLGVKPLFDDDRIGEGAPARFKVIALDAAGKTAPRDSISWQVLRLDRVWQWYKRKGSWTYDSAVVTRKVAAGSLNVDGTSPGRIHEMLEPGRYRLELTATQANGKPLKTTYVFASGWYQSNEADSPEVLDVALDKPSYKPGETAVVRVATRLGGRATVAVLNDRLLATKVVDVGPGNSEIPVQVGEQDWGAGAYATVILHRPMDAARKRMPSRAIGLAWIARDPSDRTLTVELAAPQKTRSDREVTVPIKIDGADGQPAYVTLAAVDIGILNLTRFKTPSPGAHFHAQTRLGVELRDLYGRLIDGMRSESGPLRSGGDFDAGLAMQSAPPVSRTVALFSGIVPVGSDGTANVTFEMPQFNGAVRLMAVAWTGTKTGHASQDMIVRDPVALTIATPRFLTLGDTAEALFDIHNIEGPAGEYTITITADSDGQPVETLAGGRHMLKADARKRVPVKLSPKAVGPTTLTATITGPNGVAVSRSLSLDVLAPGRDRRQVNVSTLAPGQSLSINDDQLRGFVPGTAQVAISAGTGAAVNVPALLAALDRYPYGCTEQTISKTLPLLYANALAKTAGLKTDADIENRIEAAIARVLARQDSAGGFGIWGPSSADMWLTAYAGDFLTRAGESGRHVAQGAFRQTLDRLANHVAYQQSVIKGGADLAYALYVLARNGRAPAGELRYFTETKLEAFTTPLAKAHLAAALAMIGDKDRARRTFDAAFAAISAAQHSQAARSDFGSRLRDRAAVVALAAETGFVGAPGTSANGLAQAVSARGRTSTQEQVWLILAAQALTTQSAAQRLSVNGQPHQGALRTTLSRHDLNGTDWTVTNTGPRPTDVAVTTTGAGRKPAAPQQNGFTVARSAYTLDGVPVGLAGPDGTGVEQNTRLVMVVTVKAQQRGRVLVVDRLPAGFEIDNPRLVDGDTIKALPWLKPKIRPDHTEFRDDRFVASFNLLNAKAVANGHDITVAYMVRAVTPGTFSAPGAFVEDMYRPQRFARSAAATVTVARQD